MNDMFYTLWSLVYWIESMYKNRVQPKKHFSLCNPNRCVLQWLIIGLDWDLAMIIYETEEKCRIDLDDANCAEKAWWYLEFSSSAHPRGF